ncbi:MAG: AAA family ATPase [Magnetococcales bacterium]|nr:AAA family ATPase [Magnetococcales bacterium]
MKLAHITIDNFRCFQKLDLDLHPECNLFVGINGAGKTAILDALALALARIVEANLGIEGNVWDSSYIKGLLKRTDISIPFNLGPRENPVKPVISFDTVFKTPILQVRVGGNEIRTHQKYDFTQQGDPTISKSNDGIDQYFYNLSFAILSSPETPTPYPVVAYYRATRRLSGMPEMGDIFQVTLERHTAFIDALDAGGNYRAMCQWFYLRENMEMREQRVHPEGFGFELPDLKAARNALKILLGDVERVFFDGAPPVLKVALRKADGASTVYTLEQLSDGYRNLLGLVLDFARRLAVANPHLPDPLQAPGILMIDEIDLHLHPTWQHRVIPTLRTIFPNTQLLASTHSPQIVTTVRPENLFILQDGGVHSPGSSTYGAESGRVLSQVMGTPTRPPGEVSDALHRLSVLINQGSTEEAEGFLRELMSQIGDDDPALTKAEILLRTKRRMQSP